MQQSAAIAGHCMGPSWVVVGQFGCEEPQKGKESDESEQEGEDALEEEEELEGKASKGAALPRRLPTKWLAPVGLRMVAKVLPAPRPPPQRDLNWLSMHQKVQQPTILVATGNGWLL